MKINVKELIKLKNIYMKLFKLISLSKIFFNRTYQKYWFARFLSSLCLGTISVCVAWQIYDISRNPFHLGLVGLTQFLPLILLVVVSGYVSDNYNRKIIFSLCMLVESFLAFLFVAINFIENIEINLLFILLIGIGIVRAFFGPAAAALLPNIVTKKDLPDAVALSAVAWQSGTIFGPIFGGLLYGFSVFAGYLFAAVGLLLASILVFLIPYHYKTKIKKSMSFENLTGGFSYVWNKKILLGVISLDLFAVLMAGAVALMPVYARYFRNWTVYTWFVKVFTWHWSNNCSCRSIFLYSQKCRKSNVVCSGSFWTFNYFIWDFK